ncbi:SAM-dependent methyltransferase [Thalassiella azotivora]
MSQYATHEKPSQPHEPREGRRQHDRQHHDPAPGTPPEQFWDEFYGRVDQVFSGRVNPRLVEVATDLVPGRVLDLGCGEGADAVWLAQRGWHVTAVDVSATALARTVEAATAAGVADRVRSERHDLERSVPDGEFDLVSAQYLQSPVPFARDGALRAVAERVVRGGLLLVVDHGSAPSWSWADPDHPFATPQELLTTLALPSGGWAPERLDAATRDATGPDGERGTVVDTVVLVRRVA